MKKSIISLTVVSILSGCVNADFNANIDKANSVQDTISSNTTFVHVPKVGYVNAPPIDLTPLVEKSNIEWLNTEVSINISDQNVSVLLTRILADTNVSVMFDSGANPTAKVNLAFNGTRADALEAIGKQLDYKIVPEKNKVTISATESEEFTITIPTGSFAATLGSKGTESHSMAVTATSNIIQEVEDGIKAILDKKGSTKSIPSLSMVHVTTSPSRMSQVRNFVSSYQRELSKQVIVDVQILEFSSNLGKEQGVDWNIVRQVGDGTLKFFIPSTNTISQGAGYGMSFVGSGGWDGTTALIKALKQQGTVATKTPITNLILNNQPTNLSQTGTTPFISEIKTENSDGVVSTEVERDSLTTGVDLMVIPNVQDEYVWLRISGELSKSTNDKQEKVGDVQLRFIDTQESKFSFTNKLRYGHTYVIASVKQQKTQADKMEHFGIPFLGGTGSVNSTTETLVLLTPRRAD
ncbi:hypothetical protein SL034_004293 [Vibrio harveyi]|uniref:type II secretion system protein GspD n=1 Tax=Vibrio harveyi group TaxID=717610 RepID=UPI000971A523|nr:MULTISPECIES: hypothetical protein [Vibrio harveyi group]ELY1989205.1 hypothetical protein [Vibrio harveyi]APX10097.1 hypothetical protein BWP24_28320 [Vibrio campbellii]ARR10497.1 hypothetical protein Vc3S01_p40011 [Vibrio campbellii]WCP78861.1 hypothetical protein PPW95_25505 [Vibrio parahaemolyticus]WHP52944.1 hypothetical protein QMY43_25340 [Vibrio parahaemolyticus]